jgi:hypothetical protein
MRIKVAFFTIVTIIDTKIEQGLTKGILDILELIPISIVF